ncbi:hypothetical protein BDV19DRAFT_177645 [Aspergillus venezuelensis]
MVIGQFSMRNCRSVPPSVSGLFINLEGVKLSLAKLRSLPLSSLLPLLQPLNYGFLSACFSNQLSCFCSPRSSRDYRNLPVTVLSRANLPEEYIKTATHEPCRPLALSAQRAVEQLELNCETCLPKFGCWILDSALGRLRTQSRGQERWDCAAQPQSNV